MSESTDRAKKHNQENQGDPKRGPRRHEFSNFNRSLDPKNGDGQIEIEHLREDVKHHLSNAGKDLWTLIKDYGKQDEFLSPVPEPKPQQLSKQRQGHPLLLTALFAFPYLLVIIFIGARFWDFDGMSAVIYGYHLQFEGLLTVLSVSGMIGYLTNWLAITMLFKPKYPRPLLGQGLVPSQKDRIAYRLAQAVSRDLINPDIIQRKLKESELLTRYREKLIAQIKLVIDNPDFRSELKQIILNYSQDILGDPEIRANLAKEILLRLEKGMANKQFERFILKTYQYLRGDEAQEIIEDALASVPESLEEGLNKLDNIFDELPGKIEAYSPQIEAWVSRSIYTVLQRFDVHSLVEENVKRFEEDRLEQLIKGTTNEQFRYIQYIGAVLGTIGGFVIWEPVIATTIIAFIVGSVFLADSILHKQAASQKSDINSE